MVLFPCMGAMLGSFLGVLLSLWIVQFFSLTLPWALLVTMSCGMGLLPVGLFVGIALERKISRRGE